MKRTCIGFVGLVAVALSCSPDSDNDGEATAGEAADSGRGGAAASSGGRQANGGTSAKGGSPSNGGSKSQAGAPNGGKAGSSNADAGSGNATGPGTGLCGAMEGQLFGPDHPWNQRIDDAPLDAESDAIIEYLQTNHTDSRRFRIDGPSDEPNNVYGITLLAADESTPHEDFRPTGDFYEPDCDPAAPPIPPGGAIEGERAYACESDGDCHLLVIDRDECRLFEMWRANRTSSSSFRGGCQAVWDLRAEYTPTLRGECCTSADAAGLPIAAHMFGPDEIHAGRIEHAIRFILPNQHIRDSIYVRPATHSTPATSGPPSAPPYGARLRLKASFDESRLKPAARVVARALKEYGMILSDGGNLTFTALNDRFTTHKWSEVGLGPRDLESLSWTDFEVPELGTRYRWDGNCDCRREPVTR